MSGCVTRRQKGKTVMGKRDGVGGGGGRSGWMVSLGGKLGPRNLVCWREERRRVGLLLARVGQQSPILDFFPLLSNENLSKGFKKIQVEMLDIRFEFFNLFSHQTKINWHVKRC